MSKKGNMTIILVLVALLAVGCSGGAASPTVPLDDDVVTAPEPEQGSQRFLLGVYEVNINTVNSQLTIEPVRNASAHYDVTDYITPPQCDDCLEIEVLELKPSDHFVKLKVAIRNPTHLTVYDVRGIVISNVEDMRLLNADAYTDLWDDGGDVTINPFRAFATDWPHREILPKTGHARIYEIEYSTLFDLLNILLVFDASWPGNCKEPYSIENFIQLGELYDYTGASVEIQVDVLDWQDDVNKVTLVAPEITAEDFTQLSHVDGDIWSLELANNTGAGAGDYYVKLIATSSNLVDLPLYDFNTITITESLNPDITGIDPDNAYPGTDLNGVTVSGSGFLGPKAQVKLKKTGEPDIVAENVAVVEVSTITCDISIPLEAGQGLYDVEVTNDSGLSGIGEGLFEVSEPLTPSVTGINPDNATQGHDLTGVTVSGSGFQGPGAQVKLQMEGNPNIVAGNVTVIDESTITCDISITPEAAPGLYDVEVTNGSGLSDVGTGLFEVIEAQQFDPVDVTPPWLNFSPYDVCVDGNYAYIAGGVNGLHIFDISDPSNPVWIKKVDTPPGRAYQVAVSGGYAYVVNYHDLLIIDIDPPESAYIVKKVYKQGGFYGVDVSGGYAYVTFAPMYGDDGLNIIDIDPPESAYIVNTIVIKGQPNRVAVSGGYAYIRGSQGLHIIDIDPPESAYIVNIVSNAGQAVAVSAGYAYVPDGFDGLQIIDIDPPESAYIVNTVDTPGSAKDVALSGAYAYVADQDGLQIIDIDPPESAYIVNGIDTLGYACGVAVSGGYAYVADKRAGLHVIDIDPPGSTYIVNSIDTLGYAFGVAETDGYAYVADIYAGLRIIDIEPPESAYIVNTVDTPDRAKDVAISGGYAYVADSWGGLQVIDIDPPESAYIVNTVVDTGYEGVAVSGGYAYVAAGYSGLQIVDIDPPESAYIVNTVNTPYHAEGVGVSGGYAYVSEELLVPDVATYHYLQIIDVVPPESAYIVKGVGMGPGYAADGLVASGAYVYLPDTSSGLQIIDVAPPEFAYIVTNANTPFSASDVSLSGEYAYVADGEGGLRIIKLW